MGITETRSRVPASVAAATASVPLGDAAAPRPRREELIQDRVARHRLEKRLKRRKAQRNRQNLSVAAVMLALVLVLVYLGYRGLAPRIARTKQGTSKSKVESLQRFHQDAPHADREKRAHVDHHQMHQGDNHVISRDHGHLTEHALEHKNGVHPPKDGVDYGAANLEDPTERTRRLELSFEHVRGTNQALEQLRVWAKQVNQDVADNVAGGIRYIRSYLLPPLDGSQPHEKPKHRLGASNDMWMNVQRRNQNPMAWETEWKEIVRQNQDRGPAVDYTDPGKYRYPILVPNPPNASVYPVFQPLGKLMQRWNHNDDYPGVFEETLMHFNFSDPAELDMARRYRAAKLPFKLYGVPELQEAGRKWTDEYLSENFGGKTSWLRPLYSTIPKPDGSAQESPNNFFAFFVPQHWDVEKLGLPPVVNNDWSFAKWSEHARYADSVRLPPEKPHFYWQSGVPASERHKPNKEWTFISRDLPSMSSPNETFFVWQPKEQKGIQCRWGSRGIVAATHYDSGRNMIAMITGAKRYILSPPRACSKLGIFTSKYSPIYRHSLLNFAHISLMGDEHSRMSGEERAWLQRASTAEAIDTVVKAGEVLYIPSHYFHYIISLQKSAQCNVRAGIDTEGHPLFGGQHTVEECKDP